MTEKRRVLQTSNITKRNILVPARKLPIKKPQGADYRSLINTLEGILKTKGFTVTLNNYYLGWFTPEWKQYPQPYIRWQNQKIGKKKKKVIHPLQVKVANHFFKLIKGEEVDACKEKFPTAADIKWDLSGDFLTTAVLTCQVRRSKKMYAAPRFTEARLIQAVGKKKRKPAGPRKRKVKDITVSKAAAAAEKRIRDSKGTKRHKSIKIPSLSSIEAELNGHGHGQQQQQPILVTSLKGKATSSSSKINDGTNGKSKNTKKQRSALEPKVEKPPPPPPPPPSVYEKDIWGYINESVFDHWRLGVIGKGKTYKWADFIFAKGGGGLVIPENVSTVRKCSFKGVPQSHHLVKRANKAHSIKRALCFLQDHPLIGHAGKIIYHKNDDDDDGDNDNDGAKKQKTVTLIIEPSATTTTTSSAASPGGTQEMVDRLHSEMDSLGFAFRRDASSIVTLGGRGSYTLHYAEFNSYKTHIVSKYRIRSVNHPSLIRALSLVRRWLMQHQLWETVRQYDPWTGIERKLAALKLSKISDDDQCIDALAGCISRQLETCDPVDLYYEYHDHVLKRISNAVQDKGDAVKESVNRARIIFNLLSKIQTPTRALGSTDRGYQAERQWVLWGMVRVMSMLKNTKEKSGEDKNRMQNPALRSIYDSIKRGDSARFAYSVEDDSMQGVDPPIGNDQWHRNRFTHALVSVFDVVRLDNSLMARIEETSQKRGINEVRSVTDFMSEEKGGLGIGHYRFFVLNVFDHMFPYGCPECNLNSPEVPEEQLESEELELEKLSHVFAKAFGLSAKDFSSTT